MSGEKTSYLNIFLTEAQDAQDNDESGNCRIMFGIYYGGCFCWQQHGTRDYPDKRGLDDLHG
jgi:hypothetical protein